MLRKFIENGVPVNPDWRLAMSGLYSELRGRAAEAQR